MVFSVMFYTAALLEKFPMAPSIRLDCLCDIQILRGYMQFHYFKCAFVKLLTLLRVGDKKVYESAT